MKRILLAALLLLLAGDARAQAPLNQLPGTGNAGYPPSATPLVAASTGTTGAVTAVINAAAGKFAYICGFSISTIEGITAGTTLPSVGTLVGGVTMTWASAHAASASDNFNIVFSPCVPGNAQGTGNITVTSPANANATNVAVNAWGYVR